MQTLQTYFPKNRKEGGGFLSKPVLERKGAHTLMGEGQSLERKAER
jgi:hypothetical protein